MVNWAEIKYVVDDELVDCIEEVIGNIFNSPHEISDKDIKELTLKIINKPSNTWYVYFDNLNRVITYHVRRNNLGYTFNNLNVHTVREMLLVFVASKGEKYLKAVRDVFNKLLRFSLLKPSSGRAILNQILLTLLSIARGEDLDLTRLMPVKFETIAMEVITKDYYTLIGKHLMSLPAGTIKELIDDIPDKSGLEFVTLQYIRPILSHTLDFQSSRSDLTIESAVRIFRDSQPNVGALYIRDYVRKNILNEDVTLTHAQCSLYLLVSLMNEKK